MQGWPDAPVPSRMRRAERFGLKTSVIDRLGANIVPDQTLNIVVMTERDRGGVAKAISGEMPKIVAAMRRSKIGQALGEERTLRDHRKSVVHDPERRFAIVNSCTAKCHSITSSARASSVGGPSRLSLEQHQQRASSCVSGFTEIDQCNRVAHF